MSVGMKLISSLIEDGTLKTFSKTHINPVTLRVHELEAYEFIQNFIFKHKTLPQKKTLLHELDDFALPVADEVPSYYASQVRERFISDEIGRSYKECKEFLLKGSMDSDKSVEVLTNALMTIHKATNQVNMVDFKDSKEFIAKAYKAKKILGLDGSILLGYPTPDEMSGGMSGGDLISIVGRPAMGKTFQTLYIAHNAWYKQHKTVLYIPLEMPVLSIEQRLASMHTKHSLTQIKKAQLATKAHKDLLSKLGLLSDFDTSLWIASGDISSTVDDIWKLTMQTNADLVVVDGAYLLAHPNPRLGKYERVAENARGLKQKIAMDFNIPVVASWQFNRNASKKLEKSKDAKVGLDDIGYTDEIGQLSSLVLGLIQEESIETILSREVAILKGRDGEIGNFHIRWDFYNMDFSEIAKGGKKTEEEFDEELEVK